METLRKIRIAVFVGSAIIIVASILLCVFGIIPVWAMLLLVLFPLGVLLSALLWLCVFTLIGDLLKSKNPPTCENCMWGKARSTVGHCIGETLGNEFGSVCDKYVRDSE